MQKIKEIFSLFGSHVLFLSQNKQLGKRQGRPPLDPLLIPKIALVLFSSATVITYYTISVDFYYTKIIYIYIYIYIYTRIYGENKEK